ncbi:MAG: M1 family metallopeptidase [Actinobacteria bacterium]|nr:M1 family metallopeptidase [Actinomycetota bacterium]
MAQSTISTPYRLPRNVIPCAYQLRLVPDLEAARFTGTETVSLEIHEATDRITCNALELTISSASLRLQSGETIEAQISLDAASERASFIFPEPLQPGLAELDLSFAGILNDQLCGFYRSTYTDSSGKERIIATSQMEATDARKAVPCWDEPDMKASFTVSLVVPAGNQGYSNAAEVSSRELDNGSRELHFAPTMAMSSYLVAFIVGPLDATEAVDVDGTPVRIIYPEGKGQLTDFALEVTAHALRYFTDYFAIPYPGDKLDLAAIPDFAFGAMENLGCVTFRESLLLIDPARASHADLERVVDVICHEIAHMWFGDLVTMQWWEGIWLNEAFATFMETAATDAFRPDWQRWVSFALAREAAMGVDALHSTRPIEYEVISPADARGMFDVLTYEKGGSVLRMLEQYLGAETFRNGVRRYLAEHAYGNTVTADLWNALETESGQAVRQIMDSWILQGGHPLLSFDKGSLSQQAFAFGPVEAGANSAIGKDWEVPLQWRALHSEEIHREILSPESALTIDHDGPIVINAGGWGVYRTAYGAGELAQLSANLDALSNLERATLVADSWAGSLAASVRLQDFLSLASSLQLEEEPAAWAVVTRALATISRSIGDEHRSLLASATRNILNAKVAQLGWSARAGEDPRKGSLRASLISAAAITGAREDLAQEAMTRLRAHESGDLSALDSDLLDAALAITANRGDASTWERLAAIYQSPSTPQEEQRYLSSLTQFGDAELCLRTYTFAQNEVRSQDAPYTLMALLSNRIGGQAVFSALTQDWQDVLERFPQDTHARMVSGIAGLPADAELFAAVKQFTTEHPVHSGQRSVVQAVERLGVTNSFAAHIAPGVADALAALSA